MTLRRALGLVGACLLSPLALHAEPFSSIDATLTYNSNLTNALLASDIRSDTSLAATGTRGEHIDLDEFGTLDLAGDLQWAAFGRFSGLDEVDLGAHATLRKKLGLGLLAPTLSASASASHGSFGADLRDGWFNTVSLGASQRLSRSVSLHVETGLEYRSQDHSSAAFSDRAGDVFHQFAQVQSIGAELAIGDHVSATAAFRRRAGDSNLTIRGGADPDFEEALAISRDPAFGPASFAERVKAVSQSLQLGLSYGLAPGESISAIARYQRTREPSGDTYRQMITSLVYSRTF
jgi:hypothetical protein